MRNLQSRKRSQRTWRRPEEECHAQPSHLPAGLTKWFREPSLILRRDESARNVLPVLPQGSVVWSRMMLEFGSTSRRVPSPKGAEHRSNVTCSIINGSLQDAQCRYRALKTQHKLPLDHSRPLQAHDINPHRYTIPERQSTFTHTERRMNDSRNLDTHHFSQLHKLVPI